MPALIIGIGPKGDDKGGPPPLQSPEDAGSKDEQPDMEQECGNCLSYGSNDATCHRFPPHSDGWPVVPEGEEGWCREWEHGTPRDYSKAESTNQETGQPMSAPPPNGPPVAGKPPSY